MAHLITFSFSKTFVSMARSNPFSVQFGPEYKTGHRHFPSTHRWYLEHDGEHDDDDEISPSLFLSPLSSSSSSLLLLLFSSPSPATLLLSSLLPLFLPPPPPNSAELNEAPEPPFLLLLPK
jgi:hypothetical protein